MVVFLKARCLSSGAFHLIAIPYLPALEKDFLPATLTYDDYPTLTGPKGVNTIGVRWVLIAYNSPKGSDRYAFWISSFAPYSRAFQSLRLVRIIQNGGK
jgi:hypothetical protein